MLRLTRMRNAWGVGWAVYLVAMALWSHDGLVSLLIQPFVGVAVSLVAVGLVAVVGIPIRLNPVGRIWNATPGLAFGLVTTSLAVMAFSSSLGLTGLYEDPDTGDVFRAIHPAAALVAYLTLLFAVAHWPEKRAVGPPA